MLLAGCLWWLWAWRKAPSGVFFGVLCVHVKYVAGDKVGLCLQLNLCRAALLPRTTWLLLPPTYRSPAPRQS